MQKAQADKAAAPGHTKVDSAGFVKPEEPIA